jgi:hypothetical protein
MDERAVLDRVCPAHPDTFTRCSLSRREPGRARTSLDAKVAGPICAPPNDGASCTLEPGRRAPASGGSGRGEPGEMVPLCVRRCLYIRRWFRGGNFRGSGERPGVISARAVISGGAAICDFRWVADVGSRVALGCCA